jgi:hypothetical protein
MASESCSAERQILEEAVSMCRLMQLENLCQELALLGGRPGEMVVFNDLLQQRLADHTARRHVATSNAHWLTSQLAN